MKKLGKRTLSFDRPPAVLGFASAVGEKEGQGPLANAFDLVAADDRMDEKTWELAESRLQKTAIDLAVKKSGLKKSELDLILAGDLLNQCVSSALASADSGVPFLGLYGACSTMAEGLALGACLVDAGAAERLLAAASSHFCSAERQYRFPLAYGGQRTPTAQWTATAAGAAVLGTGKSGLRVTHALFGRQVDLGVKDANNMGAAMAPSAYDTLSQLFSDLGAEPRDFDQIVTGDLGHVGADILVTLFQEQKVDITPVYSDCGSLLYGPKQDAHAGGSGCGCSACVLCGPLLRGMQSGAYRRLIFAGTGALMSPVSVQQGQSIAGICHAVVLERG